MSQQLNPAWFDSTEGEVSIPQALDNLQYRLQAVGDVLISVANGNELPETVIDDIGLQMTQLGMEVAQLAQIARVGGES